MARRKTFRKRRRRRKRFKSRRRRPMRIARTILGQKVAMTHPYFAQLSMDPAAGASAVHIFVANGMFEVDNSLAAGQPRGFDQMSNLFGSWTVVGSQIRCTFLSLSAAAADNYVVGVTTRANNAVDNLRDYMEGRNVRSNNLGTLTPKASVKLGWSARRSSGISKPLSEVSLRGTLPLPNTTSHIRARWQASAQETSSMYTRLVSRLNNPAPQGVPEHSVSF